MFNFRYCANDFASKISFDDVEEFEKTQKITVLKINKFDGDNYDLNENELTSYILNVICEQLWIRDQNYILNQEIGSSQIVWEKIICQAVLLFFFKHHYNMNNNVVQIDQYTCIDCVYMQHCVVRLTNTSMVHFITLRQNTKQCSVIQ